MVFQSNKKLLNIISSLGIKVNWHTLEVVYSGEVIGVEPFSNKDMIEFALKKSISKNGELPDDEFELASLYENEHDDVQRCVERLANAQNTNRYTECTKWRLALVISIIDNLPDDDFEACMEIHSFWAHYGYPIDGPYINRNDDAVNKLKRMNDNECLNELKKEHNDWIKKQIVVLSKIRHARQHHGYTQA